MSLSCTDHAKKRRNERDNNISLLYAFLFISGIIYCPFIRSFHPCFPSYILGKKQYIVPLVKTRQNKKDNLLSPSQNASRQMRRILSRSSAVFAPNAYTAASNVFSPRLFFSIRDPDINGTYPENACGMVLLFQSIRVYGEQLNEHMYENNEQNLSNAEICHNKDI